MIFIIDHWLIIIVTNRWQHHINDLVVPDGQSSSKVVKIVNSWIAHLQNGSISAVDNKHNMLICHYQINYDQIYGFLPSHTLSRLI